MARRRQVLLGIELSEREIRVVEVRVSGSELSILSAGAVGMPHGAVQNGMLTRIDAVAATLRRLLESLGVTTRDAVLGIPPMATVVRPLSVPPAPDNELESLVDGEIRHFQVFMSENAAYGYFRLLTSAKEHQDTLLLMGAEELVTGGLRELAGKAGVNVICLEPVSLGLLRAATPTLTSHPTAAYLGFTDTTIELGLTVGSSLCVFRRLDILPSHLFGDVVAQPPVEHGPEPGPPIFVPMLGMDLDTLAVEIRRSLEFVAREFPDATPIADLVVAGEGPNMDQVVRNLAQATGLEAVLVSPPASGKDAQTQLALGPPAGARLAAAFGLAARVGDFGGSTAPAMDLFVRERHVAEMEVKRRGFAGSLIVSIAAVVAGIVGAAYFGLQANAAEHELSHGQEEVRILESLHQVDLERKEKMAEQIELLSKDSVPLTRLIDAVSESLTAGVGVQEIQAAAGGNVNLTGESSDVASLIAGVRNLQINPVFDSAYIVSFEKIDQGDSTTGVKYQVAVHVNPASAKAGPLQEGTLK